MIPFTYGGQSRADRSSLMKEQYQILVSDSQKNSRHFSVGIVANMLAPVSRPVKNILPLPNPPANSYSRSDSPVIRISHQISAMTPAPINTGRVSGHLG
jgi:hypothetical protein